MSSVFVEHRAPSLPPLKYDIEQRDQFYLHLQTLKQNNTPSVQESEEIIALEQKILTLMNTE